MEGAIIISLSNHFVADLNDDALREPTLDKLHRHIDSVSRSLNRFCIIRYPSGVFTNDKGYQIHIPSITSLTSASLTPLCTVSKEDDESISMEIASNVFEDKNKSKLDKLHACRIAINAKLMGKNAVSELQQYKERQEGERQKARLAYDEVQKKAHLNNRKLGLAGILLGCALLAAGVAMIIFFFPVSVILELLTLFFIVSSVFSFAIGGNMFLKSYGYDVLESLDDLLPRSPKVGTQDEGGPGAIYYAEKTPSQAPLKSITAPANPAELNSAVSPSHAPESIADSSSTAKPKTGSDIKPGSK
jgi:hypothetical protein